MASENGITIQSFDEFDRQAKSHHDIRDHLYAMASQFEAQHQGNIASKLDGKHVSAYNSWWENMKTALLNQAKLHDQLGNHLIQAKNAYISTNKKVSQSFQIKGNPS